MKLDSNSLSVPLYVKYQLFVLFAGRNLVWEGIPVDRTFSDDDDEEDEQPKRKRRLLHTSSPGSSEQL